MRILITNDDGIYAAGVLPLVKWAAKYGEVVVACPKAEQSAKSHGIEIHKSFEVKQVELAPGVTGYAVDSTPADCVRFAVLGLKQKFDLVISGVNRGLNIGRDIMYSGTVSAVFEAGNLGVKAVALSTAPEYYPQAIGGLDQVRDYFLRHDLLAKSGMYNVNIPAGGSDTIRMTRQGGNYFSDEFFPEENDMIRPHGKCVYADSGNDELDTDAVMHGMISIMPLTLDRTDLSLHNELKKLNG